MELSKDSYQCNYPFNDQLMCMAAHRYCLGRRSYIVGACIKWLDDTWNQFNDQTQQVMIRDTIEALMDGNTGGKYNEVVWRDWVTEKYNASTAKVKLSIIDSLEYKGKEWPLDDDDLRGYGSSGCDSDGLHGCGSSGFDCKGNYDE